MATFCSANLNMVEASEIPKGVSGMFSWGLPSPGFHQWDELGSFRGSSCEENTHCFAHGVSACCVRARVYLMQTACTHTGTCWLPSSCPSQRVRGSLKGHLVAQLSGKEKASNNSFDGKPKSD
ncbi:Unconventional Myosin-Xviiia [Manis pentadactyla]|nr:Unconventional Myosin-Xviiia [Manis pentadactyla]